MKHVNMPSIKGRAIALICTGAMSASMAVAPFAAFATEGTAGPQTGTGSTEVTVIATSGEAGGTIEPATIPNPDYDPSDPDSPKTIENPYYNPDGNDEDEWGDNIAFSVPSAINFIAAADGTLTGPSADKTYIENLSAFGITASSFDVDEVNEWTIVSNETSSNIANSAAFHFGPEADELNAYDYLKKSNVHTPRAWHMEPASDNGTADRVEMATGGKIFKVDKDLSTASKFATIKTYVKAASSTE